MKKTSLYCPVSGCHAKAPHASDPIVRGLIQEFGPPEKMAMWTLAAMVELSKSIHKDLAEKRLFAWFTRLRQPEELYIRTLYALFVASDQELHHLLSGEPPHGLSRLYSRVNKLVFDGKGLLQAPQPGARISTFKPIDVLQDGNHVSFRALMSCIGWANHLATPPSPEAYSRHLGNYCQQLDYIHGMFKAGKGKQEVLAGLIRLRRSAKP
jgi:hypothetical protein